MKKTLSVSLALCILLVPVLAFAAEGQTFVQSLLSHLLEIVVVIVMPLALLVSRKLMQLLEKKTGIDLAVKQEDMVLGWVSQGVAYATEQAQKALKAGQPPVDGAAKKIMAVDYVAEQIKKYGLDVHASEAIARKVEAMLQLQRVDSK